MSTRRARRPDLALTGEPGVSPSRLDRLPRPGDRVRRLDQTTPSALHDGTATVLDVAWGTPTGRARRNRTDPWSSAPPAPVPVAVVVSVDDPRDSLGHPQVDSWRRWPVEQTVLVARCALAPTPDTSHA